MAQERRKRRKRRRAKKAKPPIYDPATMTSKEAYKADWERECEVCGQKPVVNATGLCGPCTFGEADTAGGNW